MQERVDRNTPVIEEFRANGGRVSGRHERSTLLLLTTTGARTGRTYTTPVGYMTDGSRLVVIASKGGGPTNPDWYHNLVANPEATVEVGSETFRVKATVIKGEERDRLYAQKVALSPVFGEYESRTTRKIPVIALERM
jgi:deazaflavin-dependent oxidoreductase (nitroreductase family)